jgi:hypothetical protein
MSSVECRIVDASLQDQYLEGFVNSFFADLGQATHFTPANRGLVLCRHISLSFGCKLDFWHTAWERCSELVSPSAYLLLQEAYSGWLLGGPRVKQHLHGYLQNHLGWGLLVVIFNPGTVKFGLASPDLDQEWWHIYNA